MSDTLDDVQKNLVRQLENFIQLSDETISLLSSNNEIDDEIRKAELTQKINDVNNLQIRMTIVASMKTGKSTILNAITGDEILPIHDEAMTTLPTEIALQYSNEEHIVNKPCLCLTKACRDILKEIERRVYSKLNPTDLNSVDKSLNFNSHLIRTARDLFDRKNITDWSTEETTDNARINKLLHYINDLVHIFIFLYPSNNDEDDDQSSNRLLARFSQNIPQVRIPKLVSETRSHASAIPIDSKPYNLLLVDTPGPNEEATFDRLQVIINEEIMKADIVLVALDYTALGTEVDKKIAETVRNVHGIKDPNYVYAVVNKVDQRQENGKSVEDVRKHIATKYEINEENVFELKARYGLIARKFLAMDESSQTDEDLSLIKQSTAARNVLRQFYPIDFEGKIDQIEPDELRKLAKQLYDISGIPELLTGAIARIKDEIIRRCVQSAFRVGRKICDELQRDIQSRQIQFKHTLEELRRELNNLFNDQQIVREIEDNFDGAIETKHVREKLKQELQRIFTEARGMIFDDMKDLFSETSTQWLDPTKWRSYFYAKRSQAEAVRIIGTVGGSLLAFISTLTGIGIAIGGLVVTGVYLHSGGIIEFEKYDDAENFRNDVMNEANNISVVRYRMVTVKVNMACNDALQNFQQACSMRIDEIMEKVTQRFDRNMEFSQCNMPVFNFDLQQITSNSIPISCRYRPFFGLVPFTLSCERDTEKHTRFHISREELYNECKKVITGNMKTIQDNIERAVNDRMKIILEEQVNVVNSVLGRYKADITKLILGKERNEKDVSKLQPQLDSLKKKLDTEKSKLDECCTKFQNDYMTTTSN